jgi:DNA-binding response OmpR family regulator
LTIDKIRLNPASGICSFAGRTVCLTRRQSETLLILLRRPNQFVAQETLQHALGSEGLTKVMIFHIRRLAREHEFPMDVKPIWYRGYESDTTLLLDNHAQRLIKRLIETSHCTRLAEEARLAIFHR